MTKYVALLRGINVGGRTIKMFELKNCFESLGFQSVVTILQTGNVVFETSTSLSNLKEIIEDELARKFHSPIKVQVYSSDKLRVIVKSSPFAPDDNHHSYVLFFENNLENQLINEANDINSDVDTVQIGDGVIYWRVPNGLTLKSSFAKYLTKTRYKNFNTNRNIKTLRKIIDS
jgi:uncharacterized protein (DUF1697 family)